MIYYIQKEANNHLPGSLNVLVSIISFNNNNKLNSNQLCNLQIEKNKK